MSSSGDTDHFHPSWLLALLCGSAVDELYEDFSRMYLAHLSIKDEIEMLSCVFIGATCLIFLMWHVGVTNYLALFVAELVAVGSLDSLSRKATEEEFSGWKVEDRLVVRSLELFLLLVLWAIVTKTHQRRAVIRKSVSSVVN